MKPSIVCVGANLESEISLQKLVEANANIIGLVTLPSGEGEGVSDYRDLHSLAEHAGVPAIDTVDINCVETYEQLSRLSPDYIFILGWSQILSKRILSTAKSFVVGSHPTPLPARRGRAPIPWTILSDESKSAVTLFKMTQNIDDGVILLQKYFELPERPTAMELYLLVADILASSFCELYENICKGEQDETEQGKDNATYRSKRTPQDGLLDFNKQTTQIDKLVRAVSKPYPGAYFYYHNQKITVWHSDIYEGPERIGSIGQILAKKSNGLIIQAGDGCVLLSEFEVCGHPASLSHFKLGDVLNYRVQDEIYELKQTVARLERLIETRATD